MKATIHQPFDAAGPRQDGAHARPDDRTHGFWVVLDGGDRTLPLTVSLPDGGEAMALFSGEDEARMFCHLRREGPNPTVRETSTGEVLSLLSGLSSEAKRVALDPFPEILGGRLLELLTLEAERFARGFASSGSLGQSPGLGTREPTRRVPPRAQPGSSPLAKRRRTLGGRF